MSRMSCIGADISIYWLIGDITLVNDTVRKNVGKDREVLRECKTEDDRIKALKEIFGMELTDEEKQGITPALKLQP